jgi:hypothetical protein
MTLIISTVLLLVMIVRSSRWLAARWREYVTGLAMWMTNYPPTME